MSKFKLSDKFVEKYRKVHPPFGFNGLGELVYLRTYSRIKDDGSNEEWFETVERVVNGTYNMQKKWVEHNGLGWNAWQAQRSAQEMYDRMFNMKFLPPGRGLWAMGSPLTEERELFASLNNCSFVSTEDLKDDLSKPFCFLMDMSMVGVGVGFDTKGAGTIVIKGPDKRRKAEQFQIADDREGWVESVRMLIDSYFVGTAQAEFDYSIIRGAGQPIKGFGGISSGPKPLQDLHKNLREVLEREIGDPISVTTIVDIQNLIGKCVVAGNVRRTAEIVFGDYNLEEYLDLKDYKKNPQRKGYGWTSNNSILADLGMDYGPVAERTKKNGEPGYVWLENIQRYSRMYDKADYRDRRATGCNPCSEQSLESYELCCVGSRTKITHRTGVNDIVDLVGQEIEVWNGDDWSKVTPFMAGKDKDLYRVTLSDGSFLDCTDDHGWHVRPKGKRIFRRVDTKDLQIGSKVVPFEIDQPTDGNYEPNAYEWGLFAGDGYIDQRKPMLIVCGDKKKLKELDVKGTWYKEQYKDGYASPVNRLSFNNILNLDKAIELNNKFNGLQNWIFSMDKESILEFVAGYIETDGNVCRQYNTDNYRIFGVENKMRDLQILLRRVGINHATVYEVAEAGEETNFGTRNHGLWCCYIPSYECGDIPTRIKKAVRIGSKYKVNNRHPETMIDASRKQKIVSVEKLDGKSDTYCFSEPENHMGVFGNVLTYQCLVETFPNNHEDYEDFQRTLKYAYLYAKSVTLGKTHWAETNRVMLRNRRIGCSVSGVQQFVADMGLHELKEWLKKGYKYIDEIDKQYSDWLAIPLSIKRTSVKPSGSVSLLAGATAGMHWPESRHYIRRVRISKNSDLIKPLEKAGYHLEDSADDPEHTLVVEVPVDVGEGIRKVSEVTMWEQMHMASFLQRYWADNQVSCTVTFDPVTEGDQIQHALQYFQYQLKGISLLPRIEKGAYPQMPYEAIDEAKYEKLIKDIKKVNFKKIKNEEAELDLFCNNDVCQIIPKKK